MNYKHYRSRNQMTASPGICFHAEQIGLGYSYAMQVYSFAGQVLRTGNIHRAVDGLLRI